MCIFLFTLQFTVPDWGCVTEVHRAESSREYPLFHHRKQLYSSKRSRRGQIYILLFENIGLRPNLPIAL